MTSSVHFASMAQHNGNSSFQPTTLFSRATHFGVTYSDLLEAAEAATHWHQWAKLLAQKASLYASWGDQAAIDRPCSAVGHWRRASAYYHFAQLRLRYSCSEKASYQKNVRNYFLKAAPLMNPPAQRLEIPFAGTTLPGYLRLAEHPAGLVLLIGGLDSAKEVELMSFAENFLARGNSVLVFDGPGQGELCGSLMMQPSFGREVSAILDFLQTHGISTERVGVFGVSFGGYLACSAAACDWRIGACICLGGFYDGQILACLPETAKDSLRLAFGLLPQEDVLSLASKISLAPLSGLMDRPLMVVHGCEDHLVDENQIARLERWACGEKVIWRVPRAEHVCTNRFPECLPVIADWMTEQLAKSPAVLKVEVCPI